MIINEIPCWLLITGCSVFGLVFFIIASIDLFWTELPGCPTGERKFPITIGWIVLPFWLIIVLIIWIWNLFTDKTI